MNTFNKFYNNIKKENWDLYWNAYDHTFYRQLAFHNLNNKLLFELLESIITPNLDLVQNILKNYNYKFENNLLRYYLIPKALLQNQLFVSKLDKKQLQKLRAMLAFNQELFEDSFDLDEYMFIDYNLDDADRVRDWRLKVGISVG